MNYIDLNSVGSTVTSEALVFPQDISEAPETASEAEEMMGVNVFETTNEWIENLSVEDLTSLISFLDEHIGWTPESQIHAGYEEWRTNNFKVRYVEGDDFKASRERHGTKINDVLPTHSDGLPTLENGDTIQGNTAGKYYQPEGIRTYEESVAVIVDQDIAGVHDPKNASRWYQLTEEYKNQKFMLLCGFEKFDSFFVRIDILERLFVLIINSSSKENRSL